MTNSKPTNPMPAIKRGSMLDRVTFAAALLHIHGFSSDAEDERIKQRIRKWVDAARKEGP